MSWIGGRLAIYIYKKKHVSIFLSIVFPPVFQTGAVTFELGIINEAQHGL